MLYHFKKWFFDLNIDDEIYIYFFIAEIRFLFFKTHNFTLHYFKSPAESLTISRSVQLKLKNRDWENLNIISTDFSFIPYDNELIVFSDFKDIKINLCIENYQPQYSDESLIISHKNKQIKWFPLNEFLKCSGTIEVNGNVITTDKMPVYIDSLVSTVLPFNNPVRKMYWGRILHSDIRISFSIVFSATNEQWGRCFVQLEYKQLVFDKIQFNKTNVSGYEQDDHDGDYSFQLIAGNGKDSIEIMVSHISTAADGAFIDPGKYKNKLAYSFLNRISKNPAGKKFISHARVKLDTATHNYNWDNLVCIDEYVLFKS
jgi:hypothetical protein